MTTKQHGAMRNAFEQWYTCNAFDYAANPIGSRECGLQWASWKAAHEHAVLSEPLSDEQIKKIARFIHLTEESRDFERLFARAVIEAIKPPLGAQELQYVRT